MMEIEPISKIWKLCEQAFYTKKLISVEQGLQKRIGAFLHRNYSDALETCQASPGSRTIGLSFENRQTPDQESGKITVHLQS